MGTKLGSKSFVAEHMFSLEIIGADEGAFIPGACCRSVLREQAPSCVPALNVSCGIDAYSRLYFMFNIGVRQRICYNVCQEQKYLEIFLHI